MRAIHPPDGHVPVNCLPVDESANEEGLLLSELLAIHWSDVDFENLEFRVTRSIWHQIVGRCKTESSAKPVPMDDYVAEDLFRWQRQTLYPMADDYVFASRTMRACDSTGRAISSIAAYGRSHLKPAFTRTSAGALSGTPLPHC